MRDRSNVAVAQRMRWSVLNTSQLLIETIGQPLLAESFRAFMSFNQHAIDLLAHGCCQM